MGQNRSMVRVEVSPRVLTWAQERSGLAPDALQHRFPAFEDWRNGETLPTLRQLEAFAQATFTPIGSLFLKDPPEEPLPLPDFRTIRNQAIRRPSANLLDTLYQCQQRQEWYRDFARDNHEDPLPFIGSLSLQTAVADAAGQLRRELDFGVEDRGPTWSDAFSRLRDQADDLGVLVMVSGIVGSNTHRKLDPEEFRGFALADELAPLVFVNGADSKAAQIFTLTHELAHVWLGESALDDPDLGDTDNNNTELWCNSVAAEVLVPLDQLRDVLRSGAQTTADLEGLARRFKLSTLVALRRVFDAGYLEWKAYQEAFATELARVMDIVERGGAGGGNFYNTQPVRTSKRFTRALIMSTLEGRTLERDAFRLLGFRKQSTFTELANQLGVR